MKIIRMSQTEDRVAWLEFRRGRITGTKNKGIRPLTRGTDRVPQGVYKLVGEKMSIAPGDELSINRGLRIENEGLAKTAEKFSIELDLDPGVWVSDEDEDLILSPDAAEPGNKPTYAAENKSLDSENHLKAILFDKRAKKLGDYNPFKSVPKDFQDQALDYFTTNEYLETLYFGLYDDRIAVPELEHYVIVIKRKDVEGDIELLKAIQRTTLETVNAIIKELMEMADE